MCMLSAFNGPLSGWGFTVISCMVQRAYLPCYTPYFPFYMLKLLREQQLLRGTARWLGTLHHLLKGRVVLRRDDS